MHESNGRPAAPPTKTPAEAPAKRVAASKKPAKKGTTATNVPGRTPTEQATATRPTTRKAAKKAPAKKAAAKKAATKKTAPKKAAARPAADRSPAKRAAAKKATSAPTRTAKRATTAKAGTRKAGTRKAVAGTTTTSTTAPTTPAAAKAGPAKQAAAKAPARVAAAAGAATSRAPRTTTEKAATKRTATKEVAASTAVTPGPADRVPAPQPAKIVQVSRRDALPQGVLEQIDTTPDDAAGAILLAAMELMGSKGPAKVSLRDIASRAGVNYGLIHRHFGAKDRLLLSIFQAFTDYGATIIRSSDTIHEAVEGTFNADSGRYADLLASAVLDGLDPHRVYVDSSGMADFAAHISNEWGDPSTEFERRSDFDPRVVGSFVMLMIVVWDFYAPYMQVVNGYEDRDLADVRAEVLDLMKFVVTATKPDA